MANTFAFLPTNAANGPGDAVDVSMLAGAKTVVVKAADGSAVLIEYSNDDAHLIWSPVVTLVQSGSKLVQVAARWMRATVKNYGGGAAPDVSVGAAVAQAQFVELIAPVGNATGNAVDTSVMPGYKTVQVSGNYDGACNIEVSDDFGTSYQTIASFRVGEPQTWSGVVYATTMRVMRSGAKTGAAVLPIVNVAAVSLDGAASGVLPVTGTKLFSDMLSYGDVQFFTDSLADGGGGISAAYINDPYTPTDIGSAWLIPQPNLANTFASAVLGAVKKPYTFDQAGPSGAQSSPPVQFPNLISASFDARCASAIVAALNDHRTRIGWLFNPLTGATNGSNPIGYYFAACFADYGNNNWHAVVKDGVTNTTIDTGVSVGVGVSPPYQHFHIDWAKPQSGDGAPAMTFSIDGALVATIATGAVQATYPGAAIIAHFVGGAEGDGTMHVDWLGFEAQTVLRGP